MTDIKYLKDLKTFKTPTDLDRLEKFVEDMAVLSEHQGWDGDFSGGIPNDWGYEGYDCFRLFATPAVYSHHQFQQLVALYGLVEVQNETVKVK